MSNCGKNECRKICEADGPILIHVQLLRVTGRSVKLKLFKAISVGENQC